jgi:L-threonylcarbamoyladenylate synthase
MNENAVRHILALKQRPESAGLILIGDRFEQFAPYIDPLGADLKARALSAWPGPVTWLVPKSKAVPGWLAGEHQTIALRIPDHPVCSALCEAFGGAIVSTSANPRGESPALSADEVEDYFGSALCGTVEGALGTGERPSEIRDLASGRVLRAG